MKKIKTGAIIAVVQDAAPSLTVSCSPTTNINNQNIHLCHSCSVKHPSSEVSDLHNICSRAVTKVVMLHVSQDVTLYCEPGL